MYINEVKIKEKALSLYGLLIKNSVIWQISVNVIHYFVKIVMFDD